MTPAELRRTATRCADALQLIYDHRRRHSPTTEWQRRAGEFDAWFIDQADELPAAMLALLDRIEGLESGCRGEPHTCDQELVDAAESRTDRTIIERDEARAQLAAMTDARDELADMLDPIVQYDMPRGAAHRKIENRISELKRVGQ